MSCHLTNKSPLAQLTQVICKLYVLHTRNAFVASGEPSVRNDIRAVKSIIDYISHIKVGGLIQYRSETKV